jgi:hypothetical protein
MRGSNDVLQRRGDFGRSPNQTAPCVRSQIKESLPRDPAFSRGPVVRADRILIHAQGIEEIACNVFPDLLLKEAWTR